MSLIELKHVTFNYENVPVLSDVSLSINQGEVVAIIGPNGSGKSTLVKIIAGLLTPTYGEVLFNGRATTGVIGYVPQRYEIDKNFPATVNELLSTSGMKISKHILDELSLNDLLEKKFSELSGGQQQRVLIALSMGTNPELLILDEPTAGVDAKSHEEFFKLIKHINKEHKTTILLVTHDLGVLSKHVKSVICLNECCAQKEPIHKIGQLVKKIYGTSTQIVHHGEDRCK